MIAMAVTIAALTALALLTGPWPVLVALALLILAAIFTVCVAGLIQQGRDYRYEQKLIWAARIQELEREVGIG